MQKHPKRPRDPSQLGKMIVDLSVGEAREEAKPIKEGNPAAILGRLGGLARKKSLSDKRRSEIAKEAAKKRWKKK